MKYGVLMACTVGIVLLASCKNQKTTSSGSAEEETYLPQGLTKEEQSVYRRLMAVHDSAMAKMGAIERAIQSLQRLKAAEGQVDEALDSTILLLKRADEGMWDWMYHFKQKSNWEGDGSYLRYLQSEERKIHRVATLIDSALRRASHYRNTPR